MVGRPLRQVIEKKVEMLGLKNQVKNFLAGE